MNYNFEIELIRLIVELLFGSIIDLNGNTDALKFRLVCRKFKEEIDRLANLSIILPISKRKKRRNYHLPSEISSISIITMYDCYKITKEDWKDVFGNKLNNLESSLRHLHISAGSISYLPKFNYLNSILWEVGSGCYELLDKIPHKELKITGCHPITPYHGSIAHLTRLSEIELTITCFFDYRLISEYLPSTILKMTIVMCKNYVSVIDLSKFRLLKCLKIIKYSNVELIEELILPTSLNKFYSSVKINKINLHECKDLVDFELK